MNREIKFRGKSKRTRELVYGYYWTNENGNYFIRQTVDLDGCFSIADIEIDIETLGQYTGLHDKNGKEIYEGDILKGTFYGFPMPEYDYVFQIYWNEKVKGFMANYFEPSECKVIGNIYDNPELLGSEK